ncbi:MAG TPA: MFS transporter [Solirubrobacteraceae bacterium]|nr:MFS transporter [Solirubrobacteraceae bacterium]
MDVKGGALVAAILGSAVVAVDATVVNVALPTIADELGGGLAGQQWVANAYLLTLASLILVSGSLSDIYGERRVFTLGVAGFGAASLLCALAPTVELLVVARALQGISGALLTPASLAIIVAVFPESERGAAIGSWTAWSGIGYLAGPLIGGQIVDSVSWRWVFALNVPLVLITLALASRYVPQGQAPDVRPRLDARGALLCALGLAGISFGLIEQPVLGWSDPLVTGPLVAGVLLFAAFIAYELRIPAPMLPLGLFRRRNFSVANVQTFAMYGGMAVQGFFLTLFLQQVAGFSALEAGSAGLFPTGVMFLLSRRFGALADRYGPRWFMTVGPLLVAAGFFLLLRLDASTAYATDLVPSLLVYALGLAVTVSPLTATVLADADERDAGIASAVNNALARTAGLLATAAVGAVLAGFYADRLDGELSGRALTPAAQEQVALARDRALGAVDPAALPAAERAVVAAAVEDAGVSTFHLAAVLGGAMLVFAGLLGGLLLRNPRRPTSAEHCPGGQFVGAPEEAGRGAVAEAAAA